MSTITKEQEKELNKIASDLGQFLIMIMIDYGLESHIEADYIYNGCKYQLKFTKEKV